MSWNAYAFRTWPQVDHWIDQIAWREPTEIDAARVGAARLSGAAIGGIVYLGQLPSGPDGWGDPAPGPTLWRGWLTRVNRAHYPGVEPFYLVAETWPGGPAELLWERAVAIQKARRRRA